MTPQQAVALLCGVCVLSLMVVVLIALAFDDDKKEDDDATR